MFEIRIICDPTDTPTITDRLGRAFTTGPTRRLPSRTPGKERLYVTADHRTEDTSVWPAPEVAYTKAPSVISEIGWTARHVRDGLGTVTGVQSREFWLRKAALLDRIALGDEQDGHGPADASDLAVVAARRLMDLDGTNVICDPRSYVRQQYAHWANQHQ
ncbi:hypothetical protein [Streptomyces sp. NPDC089799]|uniref:hypothetical protein n=1 Tax=Streptomyces sp. NPDC089799 TaxID=3155066 RepID=UPI00343183A5